MDMDNAAEVLDWDDLMDRTGGDEELAHEVLLMTVEELREKIPLLTNALQDQNVKAVQDLAHTLKGLTATTGACLLSSIALGIESACRSGDLDRARELARALPTESKRFEAAVAA